MSNLSTLTKFIKSNPDLLSKYVSVGFTLVDKAVVPLNKLMHHLLEVQGIDPNTKPGARAHAALAAAIDAVDDKEEFDKDFDFSRFHGKKYEKVKEGLKHLNLSKEQFLKITDLSKVDDPSQNLYRTAVKQTTPREEGVLNPLDDLRSFTEKYDVAPLKDALKKLKAYGDELSKKEIDKDDPLKLLSKLAAVSKVTATEAKEMTTQMVKKGLIDNTPSAIESQLLEIMKFSRDAFDSLKRVVDRHEGIDRSVPARTAVQRTPSTRLASKVTKSFKNGLFRRVEDKDK